MSNKEIMVGVFDGIYAKALADSINPTGDRLITFEISYPRIILAELNTHRMLSKNSSSSRAIPFEKMMNQLSGRPVRFGGANPGMQDTGQSHIGLIEVPSDIDSVSADEAWSLARHDAMAWSKAFYRAGYAKQVYNRFTEPFQMMKTVISGTEWANFFWLRNHEAADPTLQELAAVMNQAYKESTPTLLKPGQWHLPYVQTQIGRDGQLEYIIDDGVNCELEIELKDAIKVSCARCAAVSFRNVDYNLEKSKQVYDRLVGSDRKHASAFEHCATPIVKEHRSMLSFDSRINDSIHKEGWEPGVSHMDRQGNLWSGNFKGFIQYRKTIEGENYTGGI